MSIEDPKENLYENTYQEMDINSKLKIWEEKRKTVQERIDKDGTEMDPKIIDTVVVLNLFNIPTSASCGGHLDRGYVNPWVAIEAPNRPKERYKNERAMEESIALEFNILPEKVGDSGNEEADRKFWDFTDRAGETPEYQQWDEENKKLKETIVGWINDFYEKSGTAKREEICIRNMAELAGRLQAGEIEDYEDINEASKETAAKRLEARQEEMKKFTEFLKKKYFEGK